MNTFFITGGSRGVGKELAIELLNKKHKVIITYNKSKKLAQEFKKKNSENLTIIKCDLTNQKDRNKMFNIIRKKKIKIDFLINNAAYDVKRKKFENISIEEIKKIYEINLFAIYDIIKNMLKFFRKKKNDWNAIINLSSTAAKFGGYYLSHYAPTKAAIDNLSIGLSKELSSKKIRVLNVAPGVLDTKLQNIKNKSLLKTIPLGRLGKASEVAKLIIWLTSKEAEYINGTTITISGGR